MSRVFQSMHCSKMDLETVQGPQRFGRYILLDRMGVGGMAEVFRAVMPGAEGFRRDLVIKRILSDQARASNFIEMFGHEARISALLHHPNIVQVFDFGLVDGSYFMAMELLRGRDLSRLLRALRERQRQLPIAIAAHIAQQVALGLAHAHTLTSSEGQPLNIVHRDVSPSNIMCLRAGGVKLLDFGIASAIGESESAETATRTFKGKLAYMAPERLRYEPQDGRIDVFALGAVLWEMLVGHRLFQGKTDGEKVKAVFELPIPAPSSLRPDVPARLDEIVLKALDRDPDKRYLPGDTLADELEEVVLEAKFQSRSLSALIDELFGTAPSASTIAWSALPPELLTFEATPSESPIAPAKNVPSSPTDVEPALDAAAGGVVAGAEPSITTSASQRAPLRRRSRIMIAAGIVGTVAGLGLAVAVLPTRASSPPASPLSVANGARAPGAASAASRSAAPAPAPSPFAAAPALPDARAAGAPDVANDGVTGSRRPATASLGEGSPRSKAQQAAASTSGHPVHASTVRNGARARESRTTTGAPTRRATGRSGGDRVARGLSIDPFAEAAARSGEK